MNKLFKIMSGAIIATVFTFGIAANATPITSKGITDSYYGLYGYVYGWTGTQSGKFAKVIVKYQTDNFGWGVVSQASSNSGWAQTATNKYPGTWWITNGEHYSDTDYESTW